MKKLLIIGLVCLGLVGCATVKPSVPVVQAQESAVNSQEDQILSEGNHWLQRANESNWNDQATSRGITSICYFVKGIYLEEKKQTELLQTLVDKSK